MNISSRYLCQGKAEEGDDAVASLTDDNAALAQRVGAEFIEISARQYTSAAMRQGAGYLACFVRLISQHTASMFPTRKAIIRFAMRVTGCAKSNAEVRAGV